MKTVVLGASENPDRYANKAVRSLLAHGHEPIPVGVRPGYIEGKEILTGRPEVNDTDTVTVYLSPQKQQEIYDYIFSLHPRRIIFNPGAENPELVGLANSAGIETTEACTLVLLATGQF